MLGLPTPRLHGPTCPWTWPPKNMSCHTIHKQASKKGTAITRIHSSAHLGAKARSSTHPLPGHASTVTNDPTTTPHDTPATQACSAPGPSIFRLSLASAHEHGRSHGATLAAESMHTRWHPTHQLGPLNHPEQACPCSQSPPSGAPPLPGTATATPVPRSTGAQHAGNAIPEHRPARTCHSLPGPTVPRPPHRLRAPPA